MHERSRSQGLYYNRPLINVRECRVYQSPVTIFLSEIFSTGLMTNVRRGTL